MQTAVSLLRFINIFFGAILVGSVIMEYWMIIPLLRSRPAQDAVRLLRFLSPIALRYVLRSAQLSFLAAAGLLILWRTLPPKGALLTLVGFLLSAIGVMTTFAWYLPLERAVRALPDERVAAEVPGLLQKWSRTHTARMVFYVAGFMCFVIAASLTA